MVSPIAIFHKQLRYREVILCCESVVEVVDERRCDVGRIRVFGWGMSTSAGELSNGDIDRAGLNAVSGGGGSVSAIVCRGVFN